MAEGRHGDPKLTINSSPLTFIANEAFKFSGKLLSSAVSDTAARGKISKAVEEAAAVMDALLLTGPQRMWIFDAVLMSMISWDFLIHDMYPSFVNKLGAIRTC